MKFCICSYNASILGVAGVSSDFVYFWYFCAIIAIIHYMIEVIKSPTAVTAKNQWTVFLAGPMNGAPSWQAQVPKVAAAVGIDNVTFLNPRKTERFVTPTYQVNWETFGLRMCDVILFWIPPQARPMKPWRYYAMTTRLEMAENLARGHKVIVGIDAEFKNEKGEDMAGIRHLRRMAKYYGVENIHTSLEECMRELKEWMERPRKEEERVHHMLGPAFEPMDKLSRMIKPSTSRNETLMERWNQTVAPGDTVHVEGDFGADEWESFLNGKIVVK